MNIGQVLKQAARRTDFGDFSCRLGGLGLNLRKAHSILVFIPNRLLASTLGLLKNLPVYLALHFK